MIFLGLDDDIVRFILGDQFQQFRSICMSRIHSMWIKVSTRGLGSINRHELRLYAHFVYCKAFAL